MLSLSLLSLAGALYAESTKWNKIDRDEAICQNKDGEWKHRPKE